MTKLGQRTRKDIEKLVAEMPPKVVSIDLHLFGHSRELSLIRRILNACLTSLSLQAVVLNDLKLAITEACTNVIKHAYKYDSRKKFDLCIQAWEKLLVVKVCYTDKGFDPNKIPLPDFTKIQEGGFGVFIIRQVMDDVIYSVDPTTGNVTLQMVKLIGPMTG